MVIYVYVYIYIYIYIYKTLTVDVVTGSVWQVVLNIIRLLCVDFHI